MNAPLDLIEPSNRLTTPLVRRGLLVLVLLLFAITNLPWTLDDYDQAKQAYTSFEMVRQGHWLYQRTPNDGVATKPPLVGWISAGVFAATRNWEAAWRLPSFLSALALLWLIGREATAVYGSAAGFFALAAFGLNLLSARLATLVRTDMPLSLGVFLVGLSIWWKIRSGKQWNTRDQAILFALLTLTLWIKGPIIYAFILPGLIAYQILRRKNAGASGWSGWWPWLLSLTLFLAWVIGGIVRQTGFYETVVLKEFAGRFSETVHKPQPLYFYFSHLLQKFAPWSLLLIGAAVAFWRKRSRLQPATLWLVCWSLGGLLLMSLIPSKRVDRIFPVIPPLCLLLGAVVAAEDLREKMRPWVTASLIFASVFTGAYSAWKIGISTHKNKDALVTFARSVRSEADAKHWRYEVIGGREEGMLLYLRRDHFLSPNDAAERWRTGQLDALVAPNDPAQPWAERLPGSRRTRVSENSGMVPQYGLFVHPTQ